MFTEKLEEAMKKLNLNQSQVAELAGITRSSVSQYMTGKQIPTEKRQREIAVALGLRPDYFSDDSFSEMLARRGSIDQLSLEEAGRLLGMTRSTVEKGLKQGVFPWGYAIRMSEDGKRQWRFFINAKRFAEVEGIA